MNSYFANVRPLFVPLHHRAVASFCHVKPLGAF